MTVTDANVLLGRLVPSRIPGLEEPLPIEKTRLITKRVLGDALGLGLEELAQSVLSIVTEKTASAVRQLTLERGMDPRDFALIAGGGAGPLHYAELAEELGIATVVVPPHPGMLSAVGCLQSDLRYESATNVDVDLEYLGETQLNDILDRQRRETGTMIERSTVPIAHVEWEHHAELSYDGQTHRFRMRISAGASPAEIYEGFLKRYSERYGVRLEGTAVHLLTMRTAAFGIRSHPEVPGVAPDSSTGSHAAERSLDSESARFLWLDEWIKCPVFQRASIGLGSKFGGPALVEQYDSTVYVPIGWQAFADDHGNLLLTREGT